MVNKTLIGKIVSVVFLVLSISMILPIIIGLIYKEYHAASAYAYVAGVMFVIGLLGIKFIPKSHVNTLRISDGFLVVALSWILMSSFGAIPFVICGDIPSYVDAFFETASGFSTTGSTILEDVEALTRASLFWRSFTHWLGGMGLLVMTIALLPKLGIGGQRLMRAETTGLTLDKGSFTFNQTARNLYKIYISLTAIEFVLLIVAGLSPFDSAIHTFGSVGTGGLSSYNASVAAFDSVYVEMIIALFMLLCGINFSNLALIFTGKIKKAFLDTELKLYLSVIVISTVFIAFMLRINNLYDIGSSFRYSFFQVVSIITTTGFGTSDFDMWPQAAKLIIFALMFMGGCAGSTGGGIKVVRIALLAKLIKRGAIRKLHPNNIVPVRLNKSYIRDDIVIDSCGFVALYILTAIVATFIISLSDIDLVTAFSSVISALSNIGPGFNLVGPSCNFAFYPAHIKILLALLMIAGRLELYTIFVAVNRKKM